MILQKTSGMLVDQVIEKVSFCSPDRNYDKGETSTENMVRYAPIPTPHAILFF